MIERCLERDPARRLHDIGDAGILMDSASTPALAATPPKTRKKKWLPWAAGLAAGAALAACIAWFLWPIYSPEPIRFEVSSPEGALVFYPAVSPDGRSIAFVQAKTNLDVYVRRLDRLENIPVPGSKTSNSRPFWSPDSRRLGFFAGGKLNTVSLDGGDVQTLIDGLVGNATSYSGAWSSTGAILFTQPGRPIYRLPETGGAATPLLSFDASRGETAQLLGSFLPDGKHFVYTSISRDGTGVYEASLDGSKPVRVLNSASALGFARPAHARTGYLLFYSRNQILLRPFDPGSARLSGNAVVVQSGVSNSVTLSPNASAFVASGIAGSISGGTLVYDDPFSVSRQIAWLSREGQTIDQGGNRNSGRLMDVRISPNQQNLVFARMDRNSDIWLAYVRHEGATRPTFNEGNALGPVFSPEGTRVAYTSARSGGSAILIRSSNGAGTPETIFQTRTEMHPISWSPNGRWLACIIGEPGRWDIDLLPVTEGSKPVPFVNTPFDEYQPQFSLDGRWIAYTSNESGRYEIYVVNVPPAAGGSAAIQGRWQISTTGGQQPRWRADGKELFFISQQGEMMSVKVDSQANGFQASTPQPLFPTGLVPIGPTYLYDVSADGRRFVLLKSVSAVTPPLRVIVNWASAFGAH